MARRKHQLGVSKAASGCGSVLAPFFDSRLPDCVVIGAPVT
jgi:hypothetical protein